MIDLLELVWVLYRRTHTSSVGGGASRIRRKAGLGKITFLKEEGNALIRPGLSVGITGSKELKGDVPVVPIPC